MYVYILLDAPTHGKRYYDKKYYGYEDFDRYSNADEEKLLEKLACHYRRSRISLVIMQTNNRTDRMVEVIERNYDSYKNNLRLLLIDKKEIMKEEFKKNFIESMSNSFAESKWHNFKKIKRKGDAMDSAPAADEDPEFSREFRGEVYNYSFRNKYWSR